MPFKSKSQMRYAFATNKPFAVEWAEKTKNINKLPEHIKSKPKKK